MAARFPALIKVGPYRYRTRRVATKDALDGGSGSCNFHHHIIEVTLGFSALYTKETLLHEILHAAWERAFPGAADSWDAYEERFIRDMSPVLLGILRDNPTLVRYLTETLPR